MNFGMGLEETVYRIYSELGFDVQRNVRLCKNVNGKNIYAQIDIIYKTPISTKYVECKYRKHSKVSLEEVSKFVAVLELFNIEKSNAEIVTNNFFDLRAQSYAKEKNIKLIDRKNLELLNSKTNNVFYKIFYALKNEDKKNSESYFFDIIKALLFNNKYNLDQKIRNYSKKN